MTFLPIAGRELRVATRRRATYWSRVLAASVATGLTAWAVGSLGTLVAPELLGARIFQVLSTVAFFCCLAPGVVLTADCLSEEKRAGTLGLLFLTDLKGYDVVFGKLMVTSLRAFYGLLAIFPMLAVPFFLGGMTSGEFWRMALVLVNTMFFSLAVGMFFSSICWQEQWTMLGTAGVIIGATFVLPTLGGVLSPASPRTSFALVFDAGFSKAALKFWGSWMLVHGVAWACLLVSSRAVLMSWRKKELGLEQPKKNANGPVRWRKKYVKGRNPVEWLAMQGQKTGLIWISLSLPFLVWVIGFARNPKTWWSPVILLLLVVSWHAIVQFWVAWESSRSFNEARRSGALEQVLATPLTTTDIIDGMLRALERQFMPMLGVLLLVDTGIVLTLTGAFTWKGEESQGMVAVLIGFVATACVQSYVMAWVGLWLGLRSNKAEQAALRTLWWAMVFPTGLFLVAIYMMLRGGIFGPTFLIGCSGSWIMIGGATAYLLHANAQKNLRTKFRQAAALLNETMPPPEKTNNDWNEDFGMLR